MEFDELQILSARTLDPETANEFKLEPTVNLRKKSDFWKKPELFVLNKPSQQVDFSNFDLAKKFLFMWNDGIAFFSPMADHKLPRLIGQKPGWFDKYKNMRNIFKSLISLAVVIVILASQIPTYNKQKSQEVLLQPNHEFFFNSSSQMPLIACFYLQVGELFEKLQEEEPKKIAISKYKDVDMSNIWANYNQDKGTDRLNLSKLWDTMTPDQFNYVNNFICGNTRMSYEESALWDIIGISPFNIKAYFRFTCRSMPWANNKIRTQYYAGVGQRFYGQTWNDSTIPEEVKNKGDYYKEDNWSENPIVKKVDGTNLNLNITKIEEISLKRVSFYKNGFKFEHNPVLYGMEGMFILFWTKDWDNSTKYNNWNFESGPQFDEFWFDEQGTQFLFHSSNYMINKHDIATARVRTTPEIEIRIDQKPKMVILGITITFENQELYYLIYDTVLNRNQDARVPLSPTFNSSDIYSPMQTEFIQRIYKYKFFGISDIMGGIGGLNAFINPVLKSMIPYFIVYFLFSLSKILWFKYEQAFHKEAVNFLGDSKELLNKRFIDHSEPRFKQVINDINDFINHEIGCNNELGNSAFKEDEDQDKKDDEAAADERDIIKL